MFALITSCKKSDDYNSDLKQRERIVSFLETSNYRYEQRDGAYRTFLNTVVNTGDQLSIGDSVSYYYAIYKFKNKLDSLITTNIESEALQYGFDTQLLDFSPRNDHYGSTPMISGIKAGMIGARALDSLLILIPSEHGYGDKINGVVQKNTSLAAVINVISIKKN